MEAFMDPLRPLLGRVERRRRGAFYLPRLLLEGGKEDRGWDGGAVRWQ